jgi:hypothetical protein
MPNLRCLGIIIIQNPRCFWFDNIARLEHLKSGNHVRLEHLISGNHVRFDKYMNVVSLSNAKTRINHFSEPLLLFKSTGDLHNF